MSTKPSSPQWKHDLIDQGYTLISGDFRCRVWRSPTGWSAIVSHRGDATGTYNLNTAEDAQQWCERRIEERMR